MMTAPFRMPEIVTEDRTFTRLQQFISAEPFAGSRLFVLVDDRTSRYCLPLLEPAFKNRAFIVIQVPSGEVNKNLESCISIWDALTHHAADRHALLINLGGGMVTDLGGFAASVYKRGIPFVHIPTTLLAMVDAAIGGKCGVDFRLIKNHLGTFTLPQAVFLFEGFLNTLEERTKKSGIAEMIKHALVADARLWEEIKVADESYFYTPGAIKLSAWYKQQLVQQDPEEKSIRMILNFGHTVGHALESWSLESDQEPLLHGEAVAMGMVTESFLSELVAGLPAHEGKKIRETIFRYFKKYPLPDKAVNELLIRMKQDKKNRNERAGFALLNKAGQAGYNFFAEEALVRNVLLQYQAL